MLNGIGGRSIFEAKQNLTMQEVRMWANYRAKRGSLNIGRRIEQNIGQYRAEYVMFKAGKQVDIYDYMPHEDRPEAVEEDAEAYLMRTVG